MNRPLFSIACITYNHEKYIRDALNGFLMQKTNFPIEIIIYDDASTDNTTGIIKEHERKYPKLVKPIYQNENQYSKGKKPSTFVWPKCSGEYVAFCEGDDYWTDPYKLQKQVDFLETNFQYSLCFHKIKILLDNGNLVDDFITKVPGNTTTIKDLAKYGNYIHTPSVVLRNDFKYPTWYSKCPIGDYPRYFISVKDRMIKYLDESMAIYRFGIGIHSKKSLYDQNVSMFLTKQEIIENYPNQEIKKILIKVNQKKLYCFLLRFLLIKEGSLSQFNGLLSKYYCHSINKPLYNFAIDLMKNWFLFFTIFIKQFFNILSGYLKNKLIYNNHVKTNY
jgi:glycosyltransferase involved in cell wall biosynthesis